MTTNDEFHNFFKNQTFEYWTEFKEGWFLFFALVAVTSIMIYRQDLLGLGFLFGAILTHYLYQKLLLLPLIFMYENELDATDNENNK